MHPILFRIPLWGDRHFDIATYGVMMALGTLVGVLVAWRLGKRDGVPSEVVMDVSFWGVLSGIAGAKAWYLIQYWHTYQDRWELLGAIRSGLVWYGGALGGMAGIIGCLLYKRVKVFKVLDICAPAGILGLSFGRIGCFFNGCCFGRVTDSALGVRLSDMSPAFSHQLARGIVRAAATATEPVYPAQLFSTAGTLAVFGALLVLRRWRRFYGEQLAWLFILYPAVRFTVEFYRGDQARGFGGLSGAQVFSIISFVVALAALIWLRKARPAGLAVEATSAEQ